MSQNMSMAIKGLVLSDLHLFAHRSRAEVHFRSIRPRLADMDVLVLNGDTFDFRWSVLGDRKATEAGAMDWLNGLLEEHPACQLHYVLGNHDCLATFVARLEELARISSRFFLHDLAVQMGSSLFLHGDCANRKQDGRSLARYRQAWQDHARQGRSAAALYQWADQWGVTRAFHSCCFPRAKTVQRIVHYLDRTSPSWRGHTRDCYFGHTHMPFQAYEHEGIRFHNTGSAVGGMGFNPIFFTVPVLPGTSRKLMFANPVTHEQAS